MSVLNSIELEGVSEDGWEAAAAEAVREAGRTLRNIRRLDVLQQAAAVGDGGAIEYRTTIRLYFMVER